MTREQTSSMHRDPFTKRARGLRSVWGSLFDGRQAGVLSVIARAILLNCHGLEATVEATSRGFSQRLHTASDSEPARSEASSVGGSGVAPGRTTVAAGGWQVKLQPIELPQFRHL